VIRGSPARDPIDTVRAAQDPSYNQCGDRYHIAAGAPANYHTEPCIFESDLVKERGPFTDPATGLGYPNYSFFLPGITWLPDLLVRLRTWLRHLANAYIEYDMLIHPNTGCEVRDHIEQRSFEWLGRALPLLPTVFSCRALGCNQACPGSSPPQGCPRAPCAHTPGAGLRSFSP
jgi:hypothetical protein